VPKQRLMSPEIRWWRQRSYGTISGKLPTLLGFSIPRLYIGEGASWDGSQGLLTHRWHGQGLGHTTLVWGQALAPLRLSFGCLDAPEKNKTSGFGFIQFREYFLCITSETQKQQKTGNWHCGDLLIG
jgi:hypothetical protein